MTAAFVRGIGGMGKSAVAAKLIERPGLALDGVLVIRCHEVDPLDIPAKLASFLAGQGVAGHAEAAALLLDSTTSARRARPFGRGAGARPALPVGVRQLRERAGLTWTGTGVEPPRLPGEGGGG